MKVLFLNAAVRTSSRTALLAEHLLRKLPGEHTTVRLVECSLPRVDEAFLRMRDQACASRDFSDGIFDLAKQFAEADRIVIAAPFWDLSFPASLKQYFEHINVIGLTFAYTEDGRPFGLCQAGKLFYVTTAGGTIFDEAYGFGYVKALAERFYGIGECVCFKAEGLDMEGADTAAILKQTMGEIDAYFAQQ